MQKYNVIYADPPWPDHQSISGPRVGTVQYPCLRANQILSMPVENLCENDAALFLWTTSRHIHLALHVIETWGFRFVLVVFTWMKCYTKRRTPYRGLRYYTKHNVEFCLLGIRGRMVPVNHSVSSAVYEPIIGHSVKPDTVRDRIVELFGNLPRIELFARKRVSGWDAWGNEVESNIDMIV